uniref:Uncharacterized protein n=1 Tax=Solanum lycopersicum TaxID=4081 RepID=A0A3Q7JA44_SOLLC
MCGFCVPLNNSCSVCCIFFGLYLNALGIGGIKPRVSPFGADQFDDTDPKERVNKGSFFNWFCFSINIGALISNTLIVWIQEHAGWGIGFGIPAVFMSIAIVCFFFWYSGYIIPQMELVCPDDSTLLYETPDKSSAIEGSRKPLHTVELRLLAVVSNTEFRTGDYSNAWRLCTVMQVEELKILTCMLPIWTTGIVFSAVYAQMDIGSFKIPPASLSLFDAISVIIWVPIYDRIFVPIASRLTVKEMGFSKLQRIGIGLFLSVVCMLVAAIVEFKRLQLARDLIWWMNQLRYLSISFGRFHSILYWEQRSLCSALTLMSTTMGNYLSSFILTVVTSITTQDGKPRWIPNNLNSGHLDYFFWILAALSFCNFVIYFFFAKCINPRSHPKSKFLLYT